MRFIVDRYYIIFGDDPGGCMNTGLNEPYVYLDYNRSGVGGFRV